MKNFKKIMQKTKLLIFILVAMLGVFAMPSISKAATPIITPENISVSGATGNGGVFIPNNAELWNSDPDYYNDVVRVEWNNSASGNGNNNPEAFNNVTVNFSQFDGDPDVGSAVQAFDDGGAGNDDYDSCDTTAFDGIWTACFDISEGTINNESEKKVSVTATNASGSTMAWDDTSYTVDNVPPTEDESPTVATYGSDATNFYFSGKTSVKRKVYYEIWSYSGDLDSSNYVGQVTNDNGDYTFSGIDISGVPDGDTIHLSVWVEDPTGNYSPSFFDDIEFLRNGNVFVPSKTRLTSAINDEYSNGVDRTRYNLTQSGYTSGSWTDYVNAIISAKNVEANGAATLTQISNAISAIVSARDGLILSGTPIVVTGITVNSEGDVTSMANGTTLDMWVNVLPEDATYWPDMSWSVATLAGGTATIDADGLLTATGVGTVTVTANATVEDGSHVIGTKVITITASTTHTISGTIKYYDETKTVPNATVTLKDDNDTEITTTTDSNGVYQFTAVPDGGNYVVSVGKDDNFSPTGVTVSDLIAIKKHTLGIELTDIYRKIAADFNSNSSISVSDLIMLKKFTLGQVAGRPTSSWKFYSSDAILNATNYLSTGLTRTYTDLENDMTNQDFTGVKMGDVNNSWSNN